MIYCMAELMHKGNGVASVPRRDGSYGCAGHGFGTAEPRGLKLRLIQPLRGDTIQGDSGSSRGCGSQPELVAELLTGRRPAAHGLAKLQGQGTGTEV